MERALEPQPCVVSCRYVSVRKTCRRGLLYLPSWYSRIGRVASRFNAPSLAPG